jgi:hypothetical protein
VAGTAATLIAHAFNERPASPAGRLHFGLRLDAVAEIFHNSYMDQKRTQNPP